MNFLKDGWLDGGAAFYTIKPRPDKVGKIFAPLTKGLHPLIQQKYGRPRAVVVHCTDVVIRDASKLAKATAETSPRQSSYHFLIGTQGDLHQLASLFDRTWHAGRSDKQAILATLNSPKPSKYATAQRVDRRYSPGAPVWVKDSAVGWVWPVVDNRIVINPNSWSISIEIMGKPGWPNPPQAETLECLLEALYASTKADPSTTWAHGDLDPLNRSDPGFDPMDFISGSDLRENDGWDGQGTDDEDR